MNIAKFLQSNQLASPSYVFSEKAFCDRTNQVKEAFGPNINICFSIKANPFLLQCLPGEFSYVEVCSPGELEICKSVGIPPEKIILSGINKGPEDLAAAFDYGIDGGIVTAESKLHLDLIQGAAAAKNANVRVLLRLSDESQFGIDENQLAEIVKDWHSGQNAVQEPGQAAAHEPGPYAYPNIEIIGLHYFTGTSKKKASSIEKELARLDQVIQHLNQETGYIPSHIEYGAGLGVDYFAPSDDEAEKTELALLQNCSKALKSFATSHPDINLTVEMGRFFAAPSGQYITKVVDIKENDGTQYIIVDGGLHQLKYDGQIQGMQLPGIGHVPCSTSYMMYDSKEDQKLYSGDFTLCGSLCTTQDVLARGATLTNISIGDYLIFHRTGAYSVTEGFALFLSRDIPAVYLLDANDGLITLRDRQDIFNFNTGLD